MMCVAKWLKRKNPDHALLFTDRTFGVGADVRYTPI